MKTQDRHHLLKIRVRAAISPELHQAALRKTTAFVATLRDSLDGLCFPVGANEALDTAKLELIEAFRAHGNGTCVLGRVNLYENLRVPMREHTEQTVRDTASSWHFVLPRWDERLRQMILDRHHAPYRGTREDGEHLDAIFARLEILGGELI